MLPLDEYAKVCGLLASCNDIINGKFILANYKISNILKNISASREVYNLLAGYLNNFDFEREFSRAQLRSASHTSKLVLPSDKEKLLPFVFCLLFNLDNNAINFDMFLKEFYRSENGHGEEFKSFANAVIVPFRDFIAEHFEIPLEKAKALSPEQTPETTEPELKQQEEKDEEDDDEDEEEDDEDDDDDDFEFDDEDEGEKIPYSELTEEKVEQFLIEIKSICNEILTELSYDRKVKEEHREDIEYIANAIISNCESGDLNNTVALITAFEYVSHKAKSLKFLSRELKKLLYEFYE